jgi:predicted outer membrane repeat protein
MKVLSLIFLLFVCLTAPQTLAATFTINQAGDAGDLTCDATCTLRDAVDDANAAGTDDTISFDSSVTNITLTNEIQILNAGSLFINGPGANVLTIDGGAGTNRIFYMFVARVTITGVTLTGGNSTGASFSGVGGAICAIITTLILNDVHVTANSASSISGAGGVYIDRGINSEIINSTFSANSAFNCGGFYSDLGTVRVNNSTFSGNSATGGTGGGFCSDGDITLRSVTFSGNSAVNGGGIRHSRGTLNLGNTIVAGNTVTGIAPNILGGGTITSAGYNLIGNNQGVMVTIPAGNPNANQDIVGTSDVPINPVLGPLQNNGGTTPTHALLSGSPAINAGNNANAPSATDQRGFPRIISGRTDMGAYEFPFTQPGSDCTYSFSSSNQEFSASGGNGEVTVITQSGCNYRVTSIALFITITEGATGTGSGNISFTVAQNTSAARTGGLFLVGQGFTINQAAYVSSRKRVRFF